MFASLRGIADVVYIRPQARQFPCRKIKFVGVSSSYQDIAAGRDIESCQTASDPLATPSNQNV